MAKSRVERNKYVNPPGTGASDRRPPTWSQLCPTNFITARTWLSGARDLRYRDGAASYHSRLTPGPLWLWKYSLLRTLLPLWFDPKVGTLQTVGLEKLKLQDRLSFAPWYHPGCVRGLADTWKFGAGFQSAVADVGREGKGEKGMKQRVVQCCPLSVLCWILFNVLIEARAWGVWP